MTTANNHPPPRRPTVPTRPPTPPPEGEPCTRSPEDELATHRCDDAPSTPSPCGDTPASPPTRSSGVRATHCGIRTPESAPRGEADPATAAALFADPARARALMALADGRSLPASVLADEAGVSAQTASAHLAKLREGGLVTVEKSGRHRYYRLTGPEVATALEALTALALPRPARSLRAHPRATALRRARTCYDHLAGDLGVQVTAALVAADALYPTDAIPDTHRRPHDPLSAPLPAHPYELGTTAKEVFACLGVDLSETATPSCPTRRPLLRFCLDWTEQRHHLAGRLGAALLTALLTQRWLTPGPRPRALVLTPEGARHLAAALPLPGNLTQEHDDQS
ncbi:helix-turn-helix domain-containing protein [Streptomyces diacarni]|uniref:helix-turn-helix domain-containing protein n=1 Tax=Streptomyces diacarni TaxID=2800381 RepID=UPI0033F60F84